MVERQVSCGPARSFRGGVQEDEAGVDRGGDDLGGHRRLRLGQAEAFPERGIGQEASFGRLEATVQICGVDTFFHAHVLETSFAQLDGGAACLDDEFRRVGLLFLDVLQSPVDAAMLHEVLMNTGVDDDLTNCDE